MAPCEMAHCAANMGWKKGGVLEEKTKRLLQKIFHLSGYSPVSHLRMGSWGERMWPCKPMRTNPASGSTGWQKPFSKFGQQVITTKSLFLHWTKKNFLTNMQNVITLSEYSTAAVLVELEPAVKEEAMFQLIKPDNSRTLPAGFDQLQFRDRPHHSCRLPTTKMVIFFMLI